MAAARDRLLEALEDLPRELMVAVSGGVDSMAMLHALAASGRRPMVVHFDHGWRVESRTEAEFVRAQAQQLGLKFIGGRGRKSPAAHREAQARAARYAFFARTAQKVGVADLVLAHQADDQVETFLLQLLRGSGSAGRGMDPVSRRMGLVLHRPWLGIWRREILAYARGARLEWREDATNADARHRRNLLRRRVLPYLRRVISPHVMENLWRAAEIARAEGEWLDGLCGETARGAELEVKALKAAPAGMQRRVVLRWLQGRGIGDISFADVEAVRGLALKRDPAKTNLGGGKFARRRAGKIFVDEDYCEREAG